MFQYKYIISMEWKNNGETIIINPQNVKSLLRDNDYENENISKMYAILTLDKNDVDKITLNAKTATIFCHFYKLRTDDDSETPEEIAYSGEYLYFISNDINYNKEIDYENETNKENKDVYRQLHVGLMPKNSIEVNKQTANDNFVDTSMMNMIASHLQGEACLIEPFTYNDIPSQLVVPPQKSLSKFIEFLNKVKVFYDTQYRFFIDPDCVYIISSSGKPIPKADEKYSSVYITIRSLTDQEAFVLGMGEDESNQRYTMDVNVKDTVYTIDNDTQKSVNSITAALNPNKDNSILASSGLNKALSDVNTKISKINEELKKKVSDITSAPLKLKSIRIGVTVNTIEVQKQLKIFEGLVENLKASISAIPEQVPDSGGGTSGSSGGSSSQSNVKTMDGVTKQNLIKQISSDMDVVEQQIAEYVKLSTQIGGCTNGTILTLSSVNNIGSAINGITGINISDNKNFLSGSGSRFKTLNASNLASIRSLFVNVNAGKTGSSAASDIYGIAVSMEAYDQTSTDSGTGVTTTSSDFTKIAEAMKPTVDTINSNINQSGDYINNYTNIPQTMSGLTSGIEESIKSITSIETDFSKELTEFGQSFNNIGKEVTQSIGSIMTSIKTASSSFSSITSLKDLEKDLRIIKDISKLGQQGASMFSLNLNLSAGTGGTGTEVVQVNNENYNILKNIKSSIENKVNRFTMNKNDLDTAVFTINKEYIIKNYDARSNLDGRFLLTRKVEAWTKEDEKFLLNTMLSFDKIADESKTSDSKDASTTADQDTQPSDMNKDIEDTISTAKEIISGSSKNGLSVDSLLDALEHAEDIQEKYNKMKKDSQTRKMDASVILNYTKNDL